MILSLAMVFSMVFGLTACGSKTSDGPIKIGHLCDQTGVESMTGKEAKEAMDYAAQYIGEICGREIEIYHADTKSDPSAAVDAARQLVETNDVDVILGPTLIGHKAGVAAFAADVEVPVLFYNPTPVDLIADNEWVLGTAGGTAQMPTVMADYVYNELGYTKVVTLTKDDTGGKNYMNPFTENFTAMGGEVLDQAWAPVSDDTDYANYLMQLADHADEADCLVAWTSAGSAIQLWNAWYQMGLNEKLPIVAVFHGAFTDSFVCDALEGINADLVDNIVGSYAPMTWAYDLQDEACQKFVEQYKADHDGAYPIGNNLPAATVEALMVLQAAVEALDGDTSDKAALRDALLAANIVGPEGSTYFEEGTNIASKDIFVCQVVQLENGQYHYKLAKEYSEVPAAGLSVN